MAYFDDKNIFLIVHSVDVMPFGFIAFNRSNVDAMQFFWLLGIALNALFNVENCILIAINHLRFHFWIARFYRN